MRAAVIVAIGAGLVAALLLVIGLVDAGNDRAPTSGREGSVGLLPTPYDPSFIDAWVRGCVSSGDTEAFCRCAIKVYTARLRTDEFETASAIAQSDGQLAELPERVRDAVAVVERECR